VELAFEVDVKQGAFTAGAFSKLAINGAGELEEGFGVVGLKKEGFGRPIVDLIEETGVFEGEFDFVGFGEGGGGVGIRGEAVEGGFEFEFVEFAAALFVEGKPVAAGFPALDVLVEEAGMAEFGEFPGDFAEGDAVVEHLVDLVADDFGEVSDFAARGGIWIYD